MADFTKHRGEKLKFNVSFVDALNSGDSVSSVTAVVVTTNASGAWVDVSDQFGDPSGTRVGDTVDITLPIAAATEQAAGDYRVRVDVATTDTETLVLVPTLEVTDVSDPAAP